MIWAYATALLLLGALALWRCRPRVVALYVCFALVASAALVDGMGAPKPVWTEWRALTGRLIIAAEIDHNRAIYIWVRGAERPVAYALPWSEALARQIQEGLRDAMEGGLDGVVFDRDGRDYDSRGVPPTLGPDMRRKD